MVYILLDPAIKSKDDMPRRDRMNGIYEWGTFVQELLN